MIKKLEETPVAWGPLMNIPTVSEMIDKINELIDYVNKQEQSKFDGYISPKQVKAVKTEESYGTLFGTVVGGTVGKTEAAPCQCAQIKERLDNEILDLSFASEYDDETYRLDNARNRAVSERFRRLTQLRADLFGDGENE